MNGPICNQWCRNQGGLVDQLTTSTGWGQIIPSYKYWPHKFFHLPESLLISNCYGKLWKVKNSKRLWPFLWTIKKYIMCSGTLLSYRCRIWWWMRRQFFSPNQIEICRSRRFFTSYTKTWQRYNPPRILTWC